MGQSLSSSALQGLIEEDLCVPFAYPLGSGNGRSCVVLLERDFLESLTGPNRSLQKDPSCLDWSSVEEFTVTVSLKRVDDSRGNGNGPELYVPNEPLVLFRTPVSDPVVVDSVQKTAFREGSVAGNEFFEESEAEVSFRLLQEPSVSIFYPRIPTSLVEYVHWLRLKRKQGIEKGALVYFYQTPYVRHQALCVESKETGRGLLSVLGTLEERRPSSASSAKDGNSKSFVIDRTFVVDFLSRLGYVAPIVRLREAVKSRSRFGSTGSGGEKLQDQWNPFAVGISRRLRSKGSDVGTVEGRSASVPIRRKKARSVESRSVDGRSVNPEELERQDILSEGMSPRHPSKLPRKQHRDRFGREIPLPPLEAEKAIAEALQIARETQKVSYRSCPSSPRLESKMIPFGELIPHMAELTSLEEESPLSGSRQASPPNVTMRISTLMGVTEEKEGCGDDQSPTPTKPITRRASEAPKCGCTLRDISRGKMCADHAAFFVKHFIVPTYLRSANVGVILAVVETSQAFYFFLPSPVGATLRTVLRAQSQVFCDRPFIDDVLFDPSLFASGAETEQGTGDRERVRAGPLVRQKPVVSSKRRVAPTLQGGPRRIHASVVDQSISGGWEDLGVDVLERQQQKHPIPSGERVQGLNVVAALPGDDVEHRSIATSMIRVREEEESAQTSVSERATHSPVYPSVFALFLCYQLVRVVNALHGVGIVHGSLTPEALLCSETLWLSVSGMRCGIEDVSSSSSSGAEVDAQSVELVIHDRKLTDEENEEERLYRRLLAKLKPEVVQCPRPVETPSIQQDWSEGRVSNLDYLIHLSSRAGRRLGQFCSHRHAVVPWVIDFASSDKDKIVLRDLSKSKARLSKGDEQLDILFAEHGYHVEDVLSAHAYYSYVARSVPVAILKRFVRSQWDPREYPGSLERLYAWTCDECIPEFYTNASLFSDVHADLPPLSLPDWASDTEDFVAKHRSALESEVVSRNLHLWIDLVYGYLLSGPEAVNARNVPLRVKTPVGPGVLAQTESIGVMQLFGRPHPPRRVGVGGRFFGLNDDDSACDSDEDVSTSSFGGDDDILDGLRQSFDEAYGGEPVYRDPQTADSQVDRQGHDVFAVGCIIYEMCTRIPLFSSERVLTAYFAGEPLPFVDALVPAPLRRPLRLLLSRESASRPTLASSFLYTTTPAFPPYFAAAYDFLSQLYACGRDATAREIAAFEEMLRRNEEEEDLHFFDVDDDPEVDDVSEGSEPEEDRSPLLVEPPAGEAMKRRDSLPVDRLPVRERRLLVAHVHVPALASLPRACLRIIMPHLLRLLHAVGETKMGRDLTQRCAVALFGALAETLHPADVTQYLRGTLASLFAQVDPCVRPTLLRPALVAVIVSRFGAVAFFHDTLRFVLDMICRLPVVQSGAEACEQQSDEIALSSLVTAANATVTASSRIGPLCVLLSVVYPILRRLRVAGVCGVSTEPHSSGRRQLVQKRNAVVADALARACSACEMSDRMIAMRILPPVLEVLRLVTVGDKERAPPPPPPKPAHMENTSLGGEWDHMLPPAETISAFVAIVRAFVDTLSTHAVLRVFACGPLYGCITDLLLHSNDLVCLDLCLSSVLRIAKRIGADSCRKHMISGSLSKFLQLRLRSLVSTAKDTGANMAKAAAEATKYGVTAGVDAGVHPATQGRMRAAAFNLHDQVPPTESLRAGSDGSTDALLSGDGGGALSEISRYRIRLARRAFASLCEVVGEKALTSSLNTLASPRRMTRGAGDRVGGPSGGGGVSRGSDLESGYLERIAAEATTATIAPPGERANYLLHKQSHENQFMALVPSLSPVPPVRGSVPWRSRVLVREPGRVGSAQWRGSLGQLLAFTTASSFRLGSGDQYAPFYGEEGSQYDVVHERVEQSSQTQSRFSLHSKWTKLRDVAGPLEGRPSSAGSGGSDEPFDNVVFMGRGGGLPLDSTTHGSVCDFAIGLTEVWGATCGKDRVRRWSLSTCWTTHALYPHKGVHSVIVLDHSAAHDGILVSCCDRFVDTWSISGGHIRWDPPDRSSTLRSIAQLPNAAHVLVGSVSDDHHSHLSSVDVEYAKLMHRWPVAVTPSAVAVDLNMIVVGSSVPASMSFLDARCAVTMSYVSLPSQTPLSSLTLGNNLLCCSFVDSKIVRVYDIRHIESPLGMISAQYPLSSLGSVVDDVVVMGVGERMAIADLRQLGGATLTAQVTPELSSEGGAGATIVGAASMPLSGLVAGVTRDGFVHYLSATNAKDHKQL